MKSTILVVLTILTVLSDVSFSRTTVTSTNENEVTSSRSTSSSRRSRTTTQSSIRFPTDSATRRSNVSRGSSINSDIQFPDDDNLDITTNSPRSTTERNRMTTNNTRNVSTANPRTSRTTVSPRTTTRSSVRSTISVTSNARSRSSTVASARTRRTTSSRRRSTTVTTPTTVDSTGGFPDPFEVLERLNETSNANITGFDLFDSNLCPDGFLYDRATRSCRRTFSDY